ncbi:hypothetical protein, partial [Micrococcus luteus]|uniref:hypothetical protein n=1 Tax=Micrococcus luteus TaxID=1270 RepID=UPI00164292E7
GSGEEGGRRGDVEGMVVVLMRIGVREVMLGVEWMGGMLGVREKWLMVVRGKMLGVRRMKELWVRRKMGGMESRG